MLSVEVQWKEQEKVRVRNGWIIGLVSRKNHAANMLQ